VTLTSFPPGKKKHEKFLPVATVNPYLSAILYTNNRLKSQSDRDSLIAEVCRAVKAENVNIDEMDAVSRRLPETDRDEAGVPCSIRRGFAGSGELGSPGRADGIDVLHADISCPKASPIISHYSPITAFLIDTLAIRNASKSFSHITNARSNRHSSGASNLHENWTSSGNRPADFRRGKGLG
jgi:hypothetical protein